MQKKVGLYLFLDVYVLSVKLVLLGHLRGAEPSIHRLAFHFRRFGHQAVGPSELRVYLFPRSPTAYADQRVTSCRIDWIGLRPGINLYDVPLNF